MLSACHHFATSGTLMLAHEHEPINSTLQATITKTKMSAMLYVTALYLKRLRSILLAGAAAVHDAAT